MWYLHLQFRESGKQGLHPLFGIQLVVHIRVHHFVRSFCLPLLEQANVREQFNWNHDDILAVSPVVRMRFYFRACHPELALTPL